MIAGRDWSKCRRIGAVVKAFFRFSKAACAFGVQRNGTPFLSRAVMVEAILLYLLMNRQWKFAKPRNTCISCTDRGTGHVVIAATLAGSMRIPFSEIKNPRNETSVT